ncbi:hypothetical protein DFP72DRAFT_828109 [Ephemerocybe angulata]|uniref:SnoaL-like domain-containing protein n=1 Tax=Ephemerocybe angulata TaxID=980116 RepID=A0A8H6HAE2_9AGAR|nr:hypothetical protein DFP72DRAFT_828109 [Tulosesus angulatus]
MKLLLSRPFYVFAILASIRSGCAVPAVPLSGLESEGHSVCDPSASGPSLSTQQSTAFKDYIHIFFEERDVQKAFDRYIPGEYINHISTAASQGREAALTGLLALQANPDMMRDHVTLFTGDGFGLAYYRRYIPGSSTVNFAVMDKMRFEGTCIVEIWSLFQTINGNETNPIAFF